MGVRQKCMPFYFVFINTFKPFVMHSIANIIANNSIHIKVYFHVNVNVYGSFPNTWLPQIAVVSTPHCAIRCGSEILF